MDDFTYGDANGGRVHTFHDDPSLHHNPANGYHPVSVELMFQRQISSEHPLSPIMQQSPTRLATSHYPPVSQPYVTAYADSHTGNSYSQQPMTMRRSISSQQYSPTSSGQYQRNENQHRSSRGSFGSVPHSQGIAMTRAASQHPNASFHQAAPQPNVTQPHVNTLHYYSSTMPPSSSPAIPQYDPISAAVAEDSLLDFGGVNTILGKQSVEAEQEPGAFGQATTSNEHMNYLANFPHEPRPRLDSFLQFTSQEQLDVICSPTSDAPAKRLAVSSPTPPLSPTLSPPPPVRRRRRISPAQDALPDPVIGQVTVSGKFKCLIAACDDLTFSRQADFKRHWENVHAPDRYQFFCPVKGCSRSKHPSGGKSKGRSFNSRKDKMEEHVKTVHPQHWSESSGEEKVKGKRLRTKF